MARHIVVGAGPVGSAVARELLDRGARVTVVTRGGNGIAGTERVAADATDANRLGELAEGAVAIYNCVNPPYHRWATDWPPVANALLAAAESSGAVLAITRIPTLGSLAGMAAIAGFALHRGDPGITRLALSTLCLLVYTHRKNLRELVTRTR